MPRLTHACDRPGRRCIASVDDRRCEHASRPRHGWLATTAPPHDLARWGGSRHPAAQGATPRRPRRARYGARTRTAFSQVAFPSAIGALSLHDATRVAELRARGACLGRGQVKKSGVFWVHILHGVPPPPSLHPRSPLCFSKRIHPDTLDTPLLRPLFYTPLPYPRSPLCFSKRIHPDTLDACSHFARPLNLPPKSLLARRHTAVRPRRARPSIKELVEPPLEHKSFDLFWLGRRCVADIKTLATRECCKSSLSRLPEKCRA